ncbi:hypothetical protein PYCCODRAFT_1411717 [Trametes coccinea BRFM310]|uniref:Uncharacterized protein n=1 Tax=Trametes coccinea (strain BRFM310) TaxID=1353009 RepID=A0A1Y2IMI7_TRAC3|nr:hypothetical protein PYCCODRAFT_1411717 [Trametes coccinea BRFM310]
MSAFITQFKLTREQAVLQVDWLIAEFFKYYRIAAEDAEILSCDPTARDALIAKLYESPAVKPSFMPSDMVGPTPSLEEVDRYLEHANAAIDRHTPPQTLEQRVLRLHIAAAAVNVFLQYKFLYAMQDHHDLQSRVTVGYTKLMDSWLRNELPKITGKHRSSAHTTRTPPSQQTPLSPPPTQHHGSVNAMPADEVAEYLDRPHTLLCKQFLHSPPPGGDQDYTGKWSLESYTTRVRENQIDHEYVISTEALDGATVPMGRDEVHYLLTYSTLA